MKKELEKLEKRYNTLLEVVEKGVDAEQEIELLKVGLRIQDMKQDIRNKKFYDEFVI